MLVMAAFQHKKMEFAVMTLEEAIEAHTVWTHTLSSCLRNFDGHLTPDEVRAQSRGAIGQWLYREGLRYYGLPEYEAVMADHVRFCSIAAKIVARASKGEDVSADHIVGADSEFGLAAKNVMNSAQQLKKSVTTPTGLL
jgi:hypothetical protein